MSRTILLLCALTLSSGVATGIKVREAQLAQCARGTTTYAEVVQALGPPTWTTLYGDGARQVGYRYTHVQATPLNVVPIAGTFLGGATSEQRTVTLDFAPDSRLVQDAITHGSDVLGTGLTSGSRQ